MQSRHRYGCLFTALALLCAAVSPSLAMPFFDHHGFSYLEGQAFAVGTVVTIPTLLNEIQPDPVWPLDFDANEYTILVEGLVISDVQVAGPIRNVTYAGGTIRFFKDPGRNAGWTVNPPNGDVPDTFSDGEAQLVGHFTDMVMIWNTGDGTGVISGTFDWTGGTYFSNVPNPAGWTYFGGVSDHENLGIPAGYDLAWDPQIYGPELPNPVQTKSWGQIKSLFH